MSFSFRSVESPQWISDLIAMLDKIYENPAYLEDHANPIQQLHNLEEVVEVRRDTTERSELTIALIIGCCG